MSTPSILETLKSRKNALSVPELSQMLSVGRRSLYDLIQKGSLPHYRIGTSVRLDPKATADWLESKWSKAA